MVKERKWMNLKYNIVQVEWNKQKEWKYQGHVREGMKGPRGTELAMPFHLLYTPLGLSPGGTDKKNGTPVLIHSSDACGKVVSGWGRNSSAVTSLQE